MLQRLLALPTPRYRHHFLFLEPGANKLAKLHGSIPFSALATRHSGEELCGRLAQVAGIADTAACRARDLIDTFRWAQVRTSDVVATFDEDRGLVFES
jgi:hypothetical protein